VYIRVGERVNFIVIFVEVHRIMGVLTGCNYWLIFKYYCTSLQLTSTIHLGIPKCEQYIECCLLLIRPEAITCLLIFIVYIFYTITLYNVRCYPSESKNGLYHHVQQKKVTNVPWRVCANISWKYGEFYRNWTRDTRCSSGYVSSSVIIMYILSYVSLVKNKESK